MMPPARKRSEWGPRLDAPAITGVWIDERGRGVLSAVRRLQEALGVPVQAVRGDRVLSWAHLVMAMEHQRRAFEHGRAADDPGVEFLRFLAARKQIARALDELGVPKEEPGPPVLVVALGATGDLVQGLQEVGLAPLGHWRDDATKADPAARLWQESRAQAEAFWDGRLGRPTPDSHEDREAGVLAAMAQIALES